MRRRRFISSLTTLTCSHALIQITNLWAREFSSYEVSNNALTLPREGHSLEKFDWKGPYAEMRTARRASHSTDMCLAIRPSWLPRSRLLARTPEDFVCNEFVLHCDHSSPTHPNWSSSGEIWKHSQAYVPSGATYSKRQDGSLVANASIPGRARFSFQFTPDPDGIKIGLTLQNQSGLTLRDVAVRICVIGYDAPEIGDKDLSRTLIPTENGLEILSRLDPDIDKKVYAIKGGPEIHAPQFGSYRDVSKVLATYGLVIVQSVDHRHLVGIGFDSAQMIYTNTANLCFHTDPYFGDLAPQEHKTVKGKLYLLEAAPEVCLKLFQKEVLRS